MLTSLLRIAVLRVGFWADECPAASTRIVPSAKTVSRKDILLPPVQVIREAHEMPRWPVRVHPDRRPSIHG